MVIPKPRDPDIVTHSDHQVITPDPAPLRRSLVKATPNDVDPIARAERALIALSSDFGNWMSDDSNRLDAARNEVKASGLTEKTRETLFHASDDIKGNASTLGYADAAPVADSLCRLLEHTPDMTRISPELIDQHVDAIRAIVREHDRKDINIVATVLTTRLRQVTEEFLVQENRHRPEYLQAIARPSISSDFSELD
jgi:phosphopantothenate synthetase